MDTLNGQRKTCEFNGRSVEPGAEICIIDICKICEDGEMKMPLELSRSVDETPVDPGESYFIPARS